MFFISVVGFNGLGGFRRVMSLSGTLSVFILNTCKDRKISQNNAVFNGQFTGNSKKDDFYGVAKP